jgi:AraC-like DNA-binding protein
MERSNCVLVAEEAEGVATPRASDAIEAPSTVEERNLAILLRLKTETIAAMGVNRESEWVGLMARYLEQCRRRPLHAMAMYTLLSDFAWHIADLAARRHVSIPFAAVVPASSAKGGHAVVCDTFERGVIDVFRARSSWPRVAWDLPRVVAYVEELHALRMGYADLARHTGWKPLRLRRAFKSHTGMSVHEYVTHVRIRRATVLLAAGEKVEWVSQQVGYRNRTNFNREFRRIVGCCPRDYKRSIGFGTKAQKQHLNGVE